MSFSRRSFILWALLVQVGFASSQANQSDEASAANDAVAATHEQGTPVHPASPPLIPKRQSDEDDKSDRKLVKSICSSNDKVPVLSISEMRRLLGLINTNEELCKKRFMSSIYELDPIIKMAPEELCEDKAFDMIKDYHFRFIQPFRRANRRPTQFEPMPRDLVKEQLHTEPRSHTVEFDQHGQVLFAPYTIRHFFLRFALQVSHQCKKNLINNLKADSERVLTDDDRDLMRLFDTDSPIGQALHDGIQKMDFDTVLHMPELDGKMVRANGDEVSAPGKEQHLHTSTSENSALFQMIYACKNRFKPLYDKSVMPIVRLSKLGYDYQGETGFTERERQLLTSAWMKNWLVIVHVCEIFKNTRLIRDETPVVAKSGVVDAETKPSDSDQTTVSDEGTLVPVSEEEARKYESAKALDIETADKFRPLDYELTVRNELADKLMIGTERELELELSRKYGKSPFGFTGFMRKMSSTLRRTLAKLDLERFASYRHNSLFYSGLLNFLSSCSNVVSISVTLYGVFGG